MDSRRWTYFTESEVVGLDLEFVALLDRARHIAGTPFVIVSGYRTPERNFEVGGVDDSAHTKGLAVDLVCQDSRTASLIKKGLYAVGLNRVGNYFRIVDGKPVWANIHVDCDMTKDQNVEWLTMRPGFASATT